MMATPMPSCCRFISTRVETSHREHGSSDRRPVHLHACGDIPLGRLAREQAAGSSPRVWRHRRVKRGSRAEVRFISTRVETSRCSILRTGTVPVHLHACGDIKRLERIAYDPDGSSPRVWRHHQPSLLNLTDVRFISTRVETSLTGLSASTRRAVHLHACGDIEFVK